MGKDSKASFLLGIFPNEVQKSQTVLYSVAEPDDIINGCIGGKTHFFCSSAFVKIVPHNCIGKIDHRVNCRGFYLRNSRHCLYRLERVGHIFCQIPALQTGGALDAFIEGAKEGFTTAIRIIPYLVAFLVGIAVFRTSGAMDILVNGIGYVVGLFGVDTSFVGALPTALMKSLSGSGANGLMIDTMKQYGADSFVGRMSCVARGASDTTFYILAVYFGSVGITKTRNAVTCGLIADFSGIIAAIIISYLFFF